MTWNDFAHLVATGVALISLVSLGVAVLAFRRSGGAAKIAHDALQLSKDADARATEKHDVYWEDGWTAIGVYVLTNMGNDSAHNVKASITVDDEKVVMCADEVIGGGKLMFNFPKAEAAGNQEYREKHPNQNPLVRDSDSPSVGMATSFVNQTPAIASFRSHSLVQRITWETELGQGRLYEPPRKSTSLLVH